MKIEDKNFRELAYNYVLFYNIEPRRFAAYANAYPSEPGDNAVLTYGYIDNQAGLTFEMLCCARRHLDGRVELRAGNPTTSFKIRYDDITSDVETLPYNIRFDEYQKFVDIVSEGYGKGTDIEKIRKDTTFDALRYPSFPDDIAVLFFKPGVRNEQIWVRTSRIIDGKIAGSLMNQPNSPEFGVRQGDIVKIIPIRRDDGTVIAVAEFPWIYD